MNDNMRLQELIDALTRQLGQSMPTAMTNVSGFDRDSFDGEIRLKAEITSEREAELLREIDDLKHERASSSDYRDLEDDYTSLETEFNSLRRDLQSAKARNIESDTKLATLGDKLRQTLESLEFALSEINRLKLEGDETREKLRWSESEVNRLKLERNALLSP